MLPVPSQRLVDPLAQRAAKRKAEKLAAQQAAEAAAREQESDDEDYRPSAPSPPGKRQRYCEPELEEEEEEEPHIIVAKGEQADEKYVENPLAVPANIWKAMVNYQREGCEFILQNFYAGPPARLKSGSRRRATLS